MFETRGAAVRGLSRASLLFFLGLAALNVAAWIWFDARQGDVRAGERVPPLSVRAVLPTGGLIDTDRLTVVLDAPLVARGEDLPRVVEPPYALEPALEGTWRVAAPDRLEFVLLEPVERGAVVVARPTPALERLAGRACDLERALVWCAAPHAVTHVKILEHDAGEGVARIRLNGPLDAEAVRERLEAQSGEILEVLGEGSQASLDVRFRFHGEEREIGFAIAPDEGAYDAIQGVEFVGTAPFDPGGNPVFVTRYVSAVAPRGFTVVDTSAAPHPTRRGGEIVLEFNGTLEPGQEGLSVEVAPAVPGLNHRIRRDELVLEGGFVAGESYVVTVPEDILSVGGATPGDALSIDVRMPARRPRVSLRSDGGVLSPGGNLEVELMSTAVRSVRVTVREVLPGNVVNHVRGDRERYTSREEVSEVFSLTPNPDGAPIERHALDLRALLASTPGGVRGIHAIDVDAIGARWTRDSAIVRVTDLGVTAKRAADGVHVWVASLATGEVVAGADVVLMTVTEQAAGGATTDADGHAFIGIEGARDGVEPYLILARRDGDTTYQPLTGQRWSVPREVADGRAAPRGTDVLLYPERNLYRPGDPVHLTGIARTAHGLVDAGARLAVEVERPDGKVVHRSEVDCEPDQAMFHATFATEADARTGTWRARVVDVDSDETVGAARFSVEAFLPARLVVAPEEPDQGGALERVSRATSASVTVRALSGTSVAGFSATAEIEWTPIERESEAFPAFSFAAAPWAADAERRTVHSTAETELDADGRATVAFTPPPHLPRGLWRARATWAVTEPGGRTATSRSAPVEIDTAERHVGLRVSAAPDVPFDAPRPASDHIAVRRGAPFDVSVVAETPDGEPDALERVTAVLETVDVDHVLVESGSGLRWERRESTTVVWSGPVELAGGVGRVAVETVERGRHRLTVRGDGMHAPVGVTVWATDHDPESFEPPVEGDAMVALEPGATLAQPGSTVEVAIEAPFDGSALVVLEDERVRWHGRVAVTDGVGAVTVPIPEDARGGVALSCQLTRPVEPGMPEWLPHRAHGWVRIETDHAAARVSTRIDAPPRVRPGAPVEVAVVTAGDAPLVPGARAHLWAVDEGIRVVGRHRAPDPHAHFFGRRSRGSFTSDSWFDLMEDLALPETLARIGGDADLAEAARHLAPERVHTEPGVVWLESVPLDGDGVARFEVDTPVFTGELTWMATVAAGERFGAAVAATTLASDVVVEASTPRFLAPGDRVEVPVRVENTSDASARVTVDVRIDGGARLRDDDVARPIEASAAPEGLRRIALGEPVELAPGERGIAWVPLEATEGPRVLGAFTVEGALADGRPVAEAVAIDAPLRTGRPRRAASRVLSFDAGSAPESIDVAALTGLSDLRDVTVHVSADPGVGLLPLGRYLDRYPYGCAEQTSSRVLAYLALPGLLSEAEDPAVARAEILHRVEFGLARIANMQRGDGGIGYWKGASESRVWVSAWVAECLARAAEEGARVREGAAERLARYLDREIDRGGRSRQERVVLALALARLGRAPLGWLARLEEQVLDMPERERCVLAAALALAGMDERAVAALDGADEAPEWAGPRWRIGALLSPTRADALRLEALLRVEPDAARTHAAARALERRASAADGRLANTLDSAAALCALARYRAAVTGEPADWTLRFGEFECESSAGRVAVELGSPEGPVPLDLDGDGRAFLTVLADGRAAASAGARADGLEVVRRIVDANGEPVDATALELGDLVFVDLFVRATEEFVPDCVVVDALPGGLEVENPRLGEVGGLETLGRSVDDGGPPLDLGPTSPERVEFLDDRVLVFDSIGTRWQRYRYPARAVAVGAFEHAPAVVESMYAAEVSGTSGAAATVEVAR